MNAMHNFKIGQKVYVPFFKKYYYINGIKPDFVNAMFGDMGCTLFLNEKENTATNALGTIRLSSQRVEAV